MKRCDLHPTVYRNPILQKIETFLDTMSSLFWPVIAIGFLAALVLH